MLCKSFATRRAPSFLRDMLRRHCRRRLLLAMPPLLCRAMMPLLEARQVAATLPPVTPLLSLCALPLFFFRYFADVVDASSLRPCRFHDDMRAFRFFTRYFSRCRSFMVRHVMMSSCGSAARRGYAFLFLVMRDAFFEAKMPFDIFRGVRRRFTQRR